MAISNNEHDINPLCVTVCHIKQQALNILSQFSMTKLQKITCIMQVLFSIVMISWGRKKDPAQ